MYAKIMNYLVNPVVHYESPSTTTTIKEININLAQANDTRVWDDKGNEYIDLTAGSGVHNVGHNHPQVNKAICKQVSEICHTGWQFPAFSRGKLLEKLSSLVPFKQPKFIFTVTGSEGVEAALKIARIATRRNGILSFQGGFHGKTGGSLSVTANPRLRKNIMSYPTEVLRLPYPDATNALDFSINDFKQWYEKTLMHPDFPLNEIAAIIVEPVQGVAGMIAPPIGFLSTLRELTQKNNILLILDEIYTGMGRTGKWFGFQHETITPDIMVIGKALGGGLPMSVVIAEDALMSHMPNAIQTSTFSGHPVACAAACAVLEIIEEQDLINNAKSVGMELRKKLALMQAPNIKLTITGKGLMLGLRIDLDEINQTTIFAKKFINMLYQHGILALRGGTLGNVIKITPPLTLTIADVDFIYKQFQSALDECCYAKCKFY